MPQKTIDLERKLIGAMLIEGADLSAIADIVTPKHFTAKPLADIANIIFSMHDAGEYIDLETVGQKLEKPSILADCVAAEYSAARIVAHAELLRDSYYRRSLQSQLAADEKALADGEDLPSVVERLQQYLFDLTIKNDGRERWLRQATAEDFQKSGGFVLGFSDMNWLKIEGGDMVIVGGRPSMGKTSLCLKIALNMALSKIPVLVYSLEMSYRQVVQRIVSMNQKVPLVQIRRGEHPIEDFQNTLNAPILIDDSGTLTPNQLHSRARKAIVQHGVGMVVVDYLQLMDAAGGDGEYERVTKISKGIKRTAKDLNIPIVVACQLNRVLEEKGADKRPSMAHLRGSGAIEQDADIILFPYRPHVYDKKKHGATEAELIVAKNRNGGTGDVPVVWLNDYTLYESLTPDRGEHE